MGMYLGIWNSQAYIWEKVYDLCTEKVKKTP